MDAVRKADQSKDFDDSGCVQDDDSLARKELDSSMEETQQESSMLDDQPPNKWDVQRAGLMDLSNEVLLCILKHLSARDLKALGFTCPRLGTLILDHTLWTDVKVGDEPCGVARLKWLTQHALNSGTRSLQICGLARQAQGCLGYINRSSPLTKEDVEERNADAKQDDVKVVNAAGVSTCRKSTQTEPTINYHSRQAAHLHIWASRARQLPRFTHSPYWPIEAEADNLSKPSEHGCVGPVFTLTPSLLAALRTQCQLHTLQLHYANINCTTTSLALFPKTLKSLSLLGTKCYNMAMDNSFLSKINDQLPGLEHLDISQCEWVDPAVLIPLSKVPELRRLEIRDCDRMCEFIAYGSLAARYGFKKLESLDVRGSPLGESEVSPFAYIRTLRELYLSSVRDALAEPTANRHAHYRDEVRPLASELAPWEKEEPYYYKTKQERPVTPEPDTLPRNTSVDSPHIRPSNIFTVTLSRNSDPVIEHIAPENLHQFLISQNMIAVNVNENNPQEPNNPNAEVAENEVDEGEPLVKKQKTDEGSSQDGRGGKQNGGGKKQNGGGKKQNGGGEKRNGRSAQAGVDNEDGGSTSESEDEWVVPLKKRKLNDVNFGASTSQDDENPSNCEINVEEQHNVVKFRRDPPRRVVSNDEAVEIADGLTRDESELLREIIAQDEELYNLPGSSRKTDDEKKPGDKVDKGCDSLLREIKRSYGMQRREEELNNERLNQELQQAEEELQRAVEEPLRPIQIHNRIRMSYLSNVYYTPAARPIDPTTLVTDSCIKQFGQSDNDDVNYVHIGPNGAFFVGRGHDNGFKPPKSNLRKLVCNNYSGITNSSLDHLATAAPFMECIDFRGTSVTARGVEEFNSLRPDVTVLFDDEKKKDDSNDVKKKDGSKTD